MKGLRRLIVFLLSAGFCLIAGLSSRSNPISQDAVRLQKPLQHDVSVINIEVPVRVFKGAHFVDSLSIDNFIVTEDGLPQKIEAVYLIKKTNIEKKEGPAQAAHVPEVKKRLFLLMFEMDDYPPQLNEVVDDFFTKILGPDDSVWVVMPNSTLRLKPEALAKVSRTKIAEEIKSRLKSAIRWESEKIQSLLEDLKRLPDDSQTTDFFGESAQGISLSGINIAAQMADLRTLNETTFSILASALKPIEGQKHAFLFYQREAYRIPEKFAPVFSDFSRKNHIDPGKIQHLFSNASTVVHFLYITKTHADFDPIPSPEEIAGRTRNYGTVLFEQGSGDFYQAFRELAVATGGMVESTANPAFAFREAAEASENYYVLYYKPSDFKPDGKYRKIVVEIKGGGYRVMNRAGYIAE